MQIFCLVDRYFRAIPSVVAFVSCVELLKNQSAGAVVVQGISSEEVEAMRKQQEAEVSATADTWRTRC